MRHVARRVLHTATRPVRLDALIRGSGRTCITSPLLRRSLQHSGIHRCYKGRPWPSGSREASTYAQHYDDPTIYALSTAPGRSAIAIIRISGTGCLDIYRSLCLRTDRPRARYATLRTLYEPGSQDKREDVLDSNALVLYFPAPNTVTGEDVLELHVHGGPAIVKAVLAAVSRCTTNAKSIRYAEAGEFTRRAFMNDRLDLTQVEALGDVLSATTEQQRRLSVRGTENALGKRYEVWRQQLLYARGELEALIDFSEDQHFDESPADLCASISAQVRHLRRLLEAHSENATRGELLRNGIVLSLLGAPNAGKSSLLNCIVGREAAIVSQEAGTTRDVVEVGLDLGGYLCRLGDTAGLREAQHDGFTDVESRGPIRAVEKEGMRRAKERASESDVVVVVLSFEDLQDSCRLHLDPEVMSTAADLVKSRDNVIVVVNKTDLIQIQSEVRDAVREIIDALPGISKDRIHFLSCKYPAVTTTTTGQTHDVAGNDDTIAGKDSIRAFVDGLIEYFGQLTAAIAPDSQDANGDTSIWQDSLGVSERHRLLLLQCTSHLNAFLEAVDDSDEAVEADIVVAAEDLRAAADCLAKITGKGQSGDVEEVLGVVFEKFCVGK